MKTRILSLTEKTITGADVLFQFDYNDIAGYTSGAAQSILATLAGNKAQIVGMKLITPFDRTGTGALAVTVGDSSAANALQASTVLALDGSYISYHVGGSAKVYTAADNIQFTFTDAGSMAYTVGEVVFYARLEDVNRWPNR